MVIRIPNGPIARLMQTKKIRPFRAVNSAPVFISASVTPATSELFPGDALQDTTGWAVIIDPATYSSSDPADAGQTPNVVVTILGGSVSAFDEAFSLGDTNHFRVDVTYPISGNTRPFFTAPRTVAAEPVAPSATASDALSGRALTISVDTLTGAPSPSVVLTTLTLDGSSVLGNQTGIGPWSYVVPSSSAAQTVAWVVTASNGVDPNATASGSEVVPPDLEVPPVVSDGDLILTDNGNGTITITAIPQPVLTLVDNGNGTITIQRII